MSVKQVSRKYVETIQKNIWIELLETPILKSDTDRNDSRCCASGIWCCILMLNHEMTLLRTRVRVRATDLRDHKWFFTLKNVSGVVWCFPGKLLRSVALLYFFQDIFALRSSLGDGSTVSMSSVWRS